MSVVYCGARQEATDPDSFCGTKFIAENSAAAECPTCGTRGSYCCIVPYDEAKHGHDLKHDRT